jgi:hypothetical protein
MPSNAYGSRNSLVRAREFRTWLVTQFRKRGVAAKGLLADGKGNYRGRTGRADLEVDERWRGRVRIKDVQPKTGWVRDQLRNHDFAVIKDNRGHGPLVVLELDMFFSLIHGRVTADHRAMVVDEEGTPVTDAPRFDIRL